MNSKRLMYLSVLFVACSSDKLAGPDLTPRPLIPTNILAVAESIRSSEVVGLEKMALQTYEHSGQSIHPDIVRFEGAFGDWQCGLLMTPYPNGDANFENPSILVSHDCVHWESPSWITSPLVGKPNNGYNSDPEWVLDRVHHCTGVAYREVSAGSNQIWLTSSCDVGKSWSERRLLFKVPNHGAISPTVTDVLGGLKRLWYVDAGTGCTTTTSKVVTRLSLSDTGGLATLNFGPPEPVDLVQLGYVVWHIDVSFVAERGEYWALYPAFPKTSGSTCSNSSLFFAKSEDGKHWQTYTLPIIDRLDVRFKFYTLYRASFLYDASTDVLRVWVSGMEYPEWAEYTDAFNRKKLSFALGASLLSPESREAFPSTLFRKEVVGERKLVIVEDH